MIRDARAENKWIIYKMRCIPEPLEPLMEAVTAKGMRADELQSGLDKKVGSHQVEQKTNFTANMIKQNDQKHIVPNTSVKLENQHQQVPSTVTKIE